MPTRVEFLSPTKGRLDKIVADYLQQQGYAITRSGLKSQDIPITVNNRKEKLSHEVQVGDVITVEIPDPKPLELEPQPVAFSVVYQDEHIAVINKPYGVVVHPSKGHEEGTLVHGLLYHLGDHLSSVGGKERPGIVHRLDKDTTGLLIVALTDRAHHRLVEDFKNHRIHKIYQAIVKGHPPASGTIDAPIGRCNTNRKKMAVVSTGKPALSEFRVLQYLKNHALVEVRIHTGRTHQIRVHMAHIGHPIAGDPLYSRHANHYHLPGIALCAKELSFAHPITGEHLHFVIELPQEMLLLKEKLSQ
ncbi:Ribosomal large subunit pseudouridine synthase D [Brevinematales bacterium NS]|nr:Ribosomal large subunit pseudouridine synthase D [Brevinematales bacterium NS]